MTDPKLSNFKEFRDAVFAFRLPRIVLSALDLNLFTIMGKRIWTIQNLAKALHVSERGLDILCRNLASAGLLIKRGSRYQSGKLGQSLLNEESPNYRGAYLDLMRRQWNTWTQLTCSIRTGKPVDDKEPETPEYRRSFSWAMHERSMEAAKQVARQLNLKTARTLLDLGGGPGTYALAFLAKNPKLQATIMDRPAALGIAKEIAAPLKHGKRLSYQPCDFIKHAIPGRYDIIWLSNVIHIYSVTENKFLLDKLRSVLNPKGRIFIQDTFLLDKEGLYPAETNLFAVTMLLFTETGNTYSTKEVHNWLKSSRFTKSRNIKLKKGTGDWDGVLIQASLPSGQRKT